SPYSYPTSSSLILRPPCPPLFPYTTLFRSCPYMGTELAIHSFPHRVVVGEGEADAGDRCGRYQRREDQPGKRKELDAAGAHLARSEEHTSELQSRFDLVCRLLLEKKKKK